MGVDTKNYSVACAQKLGEIIALFLKLQELPFGDSTTAFLDNALVKKHIEQYSDKNTKSWYLIENYIVNVNNPILAETNFNLISGWVKEVVSVAFTPCGTGLLPPAFYNTQFIKNIYLSNNERLIALFSKHLPVPKAEVFDEYSMPAFIAKRQQESAEAILKFFEKNKNNLSNVENSVIKIQRLYRIKKRLREERVRVPKSIDVDKDVIMNANDMLREASTPYLPQKCNAILAHRIFSLAKKVVLFSSVRHLTTTTALVNILNDALYGRQTLLLSYQSFKRAALGKADQADGDSNVICFGPNMIDPKSEQPNPIEIVLDLKKIKHNPCVFYKQRDFGYTVSLKEERSFFLGKEQIFFSHTERFLPKESSQRGCVEFKLYQCHGREPFAYACIPKYLLIAYDLDKIHQILTLNFFRFIDALKDMNHVPPVSFVEKFYAHLETLSNDALREFLQKVGIQATDTAEFNFYGAHKTDFDSLLEIKSKAYTLNLQNFVRDLQLGKIEVIAKARNEISELFESYRFVDYLLSRVTNEASKVELQKFRASCVMPFWMKAMHIHKDTDTVVTKNKVEFS